MISFVWSNFLNSRYKLENPETIKQIRAKEKKGCVGTLKAKTIA